MDTRKNEDILKKYKDNKNITRYDRDFIYSNYTTYINNNHNYNEYQKELILNYLRNMLVHTNKVLLIDELDNSIHDILRASMEKEILASNLKKYMEYRKLNVNDLAVKMDLPYSTVNDWVNAVSYPRPDKLRRLAEAFGVTKRDLTEPHNEIKKSNSIPVLGRIPAGIPIEAIEEILDYEEIPQSWLTGGKDFFALKIEGKSMYPYYCPRRYCYI